MSEKLEKFLEENRASKRMKKKQGHLMDFLAVKNDVERVIAKGWYVKEIWETLSKKEAVTMSYQTFNEYVRKYLTHKEQNSAAPPIDEIKKQKTVKTEFKYNPLPNPEDIF